MARGKIRSQKDTPDGVRYTVEMEDGSTRDVGPDDLETDDEPEPEKKPEKKDVKENKPEADKAAPSDAKWYQYDLEGGVITINEYRATKGQSRDARFAEMTLPEYQAANAAVYAAAAATKTGDLAPKPGGAPAGPPQAPPIDYGAEVEV